MTLRFFDRVDLGRIGGIPIGTPPLRESALQRAYKRARLFERQTLQRKMMPSYWSRQMAARD